MKTKILLFAVGAFLFPNTMQAAAVYQCPSSGITYADFSTCNSGCAQSANCSASNLSITNNTTKGPCPGGYRWVEYYDKVSSSSSEINFYGVCNRPLYSPYFVFPASGSISIPGVSFSSSLIGSGYSMTGACASSDGKSIDFYGGGVVKSKITLNGATVVTSSSTPSCTGPYPGSITSITSSGNQLNFLNSVGTTISTINFASSVFSCPLSGGSACSGSPQTCSIPQTCALLDNGCAENTCTGQTCWNGTANVNGTKTTGECVSPTGLINTCSQFGDSVTVSWNPVIGATGYHLRIDDVSDVWFTPTTDTLNDFNPSISFTRAVTPGQQYNWWVHSAAGSNYSPATPVAFTCACTPTAPGCAANTCTGAQCNTGCGLMNGTNTDGVCCISNDSCKTDTCSGSKCTDNCGREVNGEKNCGGIDMGTWREVAP